MCIQHGMLLINHLYYYIMGKIVPEGNISLNTSSRWGHPLGHGGLLDPHKLQGGRVMVQKKLSSSLQKSKTFNDLKLPRESIHSPIIIGHSTSSLVQMFDPETKFEKISQSCFRQTNVSQSCCNFRGWSCPLILLFLNKKANCCLKWPKVYINNWNSTRCFKFT